MSSSRAGRLLLGPMRGRGGSVEGHPRPPDGLWPPRRVAGDGGADPSMILAAAAVDALATSRKALDVAVTPDRDVAGRVAAGLVAEVRGDDVGGGLGDHLGVGPVIVAVEAEVEPVRASSWARVWARCAGSLLLLDDDPVLGVR